jgi:hypothetical protein
MKSMAKFNTILVVASMDRIHGFRKYLLLCVHGKLLHSKSPTTEAATRLTATHVARRTTHVAVCSLHMELNPSLYKINNKY